MISVKNIVRSFGHKRAVNDISFNLRRGEVLAFLGPNGAGKSTTMRIITGCIAPSEGCVEIAGLNIQCSPIKTKKLLGYLPENSPLYREMTVSGFLRFVGRIRGLRKKQLNSSLDNMIEACQLAEVVYQDINTLSKGFLRRVCLAQALIHNPTYIILDEPTDGLDPNQKELIRSLIRSLGKEKAIIISTHILDEVDSCCSKVVVISKGKVVASGTPDDLKNKSSTAGTILVSFKDNNDHVLSELTALSFVDLALFDETVSQFRILPSPSCSVSSVVDLLLKKVSGRGWELKSLELDNGSLDVFFREVTL